MGAMEPGMRLGKTPPFYDLDPVRGFQELCRDLFDRQPGISTCEIYGTPGQTQDGIDLLARREDGDGVEVGQCKCYQRFPPAEIRKASAEFLKHHRDVWASQKVRRFILFVACELNSTKQQEEITKQTRDFAELGIRYEAWSAPKIRNALGPHRDIVTRYIPDRYWVRDICGDPETSTPGGLAAQNQQAIIYAALAEQNVHLAALASQGTEQDLEAMRRAWREGRHADTRSWLAGIRADTTRWAVLPSRLRARVLRFEAAVELDTQGDINRARQLAEEARGLAPEDDRPALWAFIAYRQDGPATAICLLDGQSDDDSLHLRVAIHLQSGELDAGLAILDEIIRNGRQTAETFRLQSLCHLRAGDLAAARVAAAKTLEMEPNNLNGQLAAASISYFSGLAPFAAPDHLVAAPEPVEWMLVRRDDESLARVREAARVFRDLAERASAEPAERQTFQAWRLACLGIDPERQEDAAHLCRAMLAEDPADYRPVAWALARRWDVDLTPSQAALESLVSAGAASLPHIVALVRLHFVVGDHGAAARVLDQTRSIFETEGTTELWTLLRALAAAGSEADRAPVAVDEANEMTPSPRVRAVGLEAAARASGNWTSLADHLERSFADTGDTRFMLDWCELMASLGNWAAVAQRIDWLTDAIGTADALRLAAYAAYHVRDFDRCTHLLDDHCAWFPGERLPRDLRRLRAVCQQERGMLTDAIAEAVALAREEPTTQHQFHLAQLLAEKGDSTGVSQVARQLLEQAELPSDVALQVAVWVQMADRESAVALWRRAGRQGYADEHLPNAVMLGYRVGLDSEADALMSRLLRLSERGGDAVAVVPVEDIPSVLARQRERAMQLEEAYRNGVAPIHVIAEQVHRSLVALYHLRLQMNEAVPDPLRQPALLVRHGGRAALREDGEQEEEKGAQPMWRLHADVTAILLAAHLDVLDTIESAYGSIWVPSALVPALAAMRNEIATAQPSRLEWYREIRQLVEMGTLKVLQPQPPDSERDARLAQDLGEDWVALLAAARHGGGYLVDFFPLRKRDLSEVTTLADDVARYVVSCGAVAESLRQDGPLSADDHARAVATLGDQARPPASGVIAHQGVPLYCSGNIPEVLAQAGLLEAACQRFQVWVEQAYVDDVRAQLQAHEQRQETAVWLDRLVRRISDGIDAGTYKVIPSSASARDDEKESRRHEPSVDCLKELLRYQPGEGDVVWVDDRFVSSFLHREGAPIIGIFEVLGYLYERGFLDAASYYDKLRRLRAANVRFLPLAKGELLHHLRQARVTDGRVVETEALTILRRYVAACLAQSALLQRGVATNSVGNLSGEIPFPIRVLGEVRSALIEVWEDAADELVARARAEWLLTNLHVDDAGLAKLAGSPRGPEDAVRAAAMSIAGLLSAAVGASARPDSGAEKYFRWLFDRVLRPRFCADPQLLGAMVEYLKELLLATLQDAPELIAPAAAATLRRFHDRLPPPIRDALSRDTDLMAAIGRQRRNVTVAQGVTFDPSEFWMAAAEAVNGREAHLNAIRPPGEVAIRPVSPSAEDGGDLACTFTHPTTGETCVLRDPDLGILHESITVREATLYRLRPWFDCPPETFAHLVAEIGTVSDPLNRITAARAWRDSSVTAHDATLAKALGGSQGFRIDELLPSSGDGLLRHLRLELDDVRGRSFEDMLAGAASRLVAEGDVGDAVERFIGLPVPLPGPLVEAIGALSADARRALVKRLLNAARSPIGRMHLARLIVRFGDERPAYRRLARRILKHLMSGDGINACDAFLAVLAWTTDELDQRSDTRDWPADLRLAIGWSCAHRLFSILISAGASVAWLRGVFDETNTRALAAWVVRHGDCWFDVAYPRQVTSTSFLLAGAGYAVDQGGADVVDQRLRDLMGQLAFMGAAEERTPAMVALRDHTCASNQLGSVLGWDRGKSLEVLLGPQNAELFSKEELHRTVAQAISALMDEDDWQFAWVQLFAVLGSLPVYDDLADQLRAALRSTDFVALMQRDVTVGTLALHVASLQAVHLADTDLRDHLVSELVRVVAFLSDEQHAALDAAAFGPDGLTTADRVQWRIVEAAMAVALTPTGPSSEAMAAFAALVTAIVDVWSAPTPILRRVVQRLAEQLPIAAVAELWPVLVRLRAE